MTYFYYTVGLVISAEIFWSLFLAYCSLKRAKANGLLTKPAAFCAIPIMLTGGVMDIAFNILATIPFWDIPRDLYLTKRLSRYYNTDPEDTSWRKQRAAFIAINFTNGFDEDHIK